ncbi:MAG: CocE/NonD family hydrolase [Bryobacteraceae bacterium]
MRILRNLWVPMDDGVHLAADVYLPKQAERFPAVLYSGPYRKDDRILRAGSASGLPELFTGRGYAFVCADVRGTNDSEGIAEVMFSPREQRDGYELVEWIAAQDWCDGNVGMTGISYGYFTSVLTAALQPPHLKTIVPMHASVSWYYCVHEGGLPLMFGYHANYVTLMLAFLGAPPGYRDPHGRWREAWLHRLKNGPAWGLDWLDHPLEGDYWQAVSPERDYSRIRIPVFAVHGWWDRYPSDAFRLAENIAGPVKLLIGPWQHARPDSGIPGPRIDYEIFLRWFDYWLKGVANGILDEPRFTYYRQRYQEPMDYPVEMNGEWRQEPGWPARRADTRRLYLHGGGKLDESEPVERSDQAYEYDPTAGLCSRLSGGIYGGVGMPLDQRPDERKSVIYSTAPLDDPLEITGIPRAHIQFSSTAHVMGLIVKLCDVAPDGAVALVTRGYLNATHRDGHTRAEPLEPGRVYSLDVEMKATSYLFERGHRLRLAITSAEFPTLLPTPERGTNHVISGAGETSWVDLPVLPPASAQQSPVSLKILPPPSPQLAANKSLRVFEDESGQGVAELSTTDSFRGLDARIEVRHNTTARVHRERPEGAVYESDCTLSLHYDDGGVIESRGEVRYQGGAGSLLVDANISVTVNGGVTFRRSWTFDQPRRCF